MHAPTSTTPIHARHPPSATPEGEERYFIGIIDFLVPFDTKKSAEHTYKTMVGQTNHSVVPPVRDL